jgi:hypothetical protein
MKFYNFYTNLNSSTSHAENYLNKIKRILIHKQDETYYSQDHLDLENLRSLTLMTQLNPTVFNSLEEKTLPIISFLNRNSNSQRYISSNNPALAFASELDPTNQLYNDPIDSETRKLYRMFYTTPNHGNFINLYFNNDRSSPNKNFLNFLRAFENTYNTSELYELNLDIHNSILNDGYVCWVDSIEDSETLNGSDRASPLREIARLYISFFNFLLKLKNGLQEEVPADDLGRALWTRLLAIDTRSSFSHIDFERPTELLLQLTDDEIQHKINIFSSIKVFNYVKMNTLKDAEEEKVYSHFSNEFYSKFKEDIKEPTKKNENNLIKLESRPLYLQFSHSNYVDRNWQYSNLFNDMGNYNSLIYTFPIDEDTQYIPIAGTSGLMFSDLEEKFTNIDVPASLENNPNKRVFGLMLNAFTKATNKPAFEFVDITKKQALIRKGFFIPVLVKFLSCNSSGNIETVYNFSLLNYSDNLHQVKKRRRSRLQLEAFLKAYGQNGLMLVNYEKFLSQQQEKMKGLAEYSIANASTYLNYDVNQIESLVSSLSRRKQTISNRISSKLTEFSDAITATLNISPVVKKKYVKVSSHYNKLIDQNKVAKTSSQEAAYLLENNNADIQNNLNQILRLQEQIATYKANITKSNNSIRDNFNKRVDLVKTISTNKSLYQKTLERYDLAIKEALEKNDYSSNNFFQNLYNNEGIKILSISSDEDNQLIDSNLNPNILQDYSAKIISKEKAMVIKEVEFLIDKPVKISVDAGKKGEIAAGPYIVKVKQNRIHISLAYPSSIHGYNPDGQYIYVHPHASSFGLNGLLNYFNETHSNFSSGCLGEASALLYKAFEKNDLKMILISALTWVKNANSADPWGRNYVYFPKYEDAIQPKAKSKETESEITEDDVGDFIEDMISLQQETEEIQAPPQEEPAPLEEETEEQEITGIESFNTTETYVPYTQR